MKNAQVHTTISPKHRELLKKLSEKYETQQKALELALERLADDSKNDTALTPEMKLWARIGKDVDVLCLIPKEGLKELLRTADLDAFFALVKDTKPLQQAIEFYWQKSAEELTLREIVEGLAMNAKVENWFYLTDYTDDGDHYTIRLYHSLGMNNSRISRVMCETMFDTYGYKYESSISDRYLFMKVYKNNGPPDIKQKTNADI